MIFNSNYCKGFSEHVNYFLYFLPFKIYLLILIRIGVYFFLTLGLFLANILNTASLAAMLLKKVNL